MGSSPARSILSNFWVCGAMDSVTRFEREGCGFESCQTCSAKHANKGDLASAKK